MKRNYSTRLLASVILCTMLLSLISCTNRVYNNNTMHTVTSFSFTEDGKARVSVDYTGYRDTEGATIRIHIEKQVFLFFWDEFLTEEHTAVGESYQNEFFYPVSEEGTYRCTVTYTVFGKGEDDVITFTDTKTYQASETMPESSETTETKQEPPITPTQIGFISPADEIEVSKTFFSENENVRLEFTFYGYASDSLGENFYLKSNEPIRASVKAINISDITIYQHSPAYCPVCHQFGFHFQTADEAPLLYDSSWCTGTLAVEILEIAPGESFGHTDLEFIAGEYVSEEELIDIHASNYYATSGYQLFGHECYEDDVLHFSGEVSFSYSKTPIDDNMPDLQEIFCEIPSLKIFYVEFDKEERYPVFTSPADEVRTEKTFAISNDDGIQLAFTVQGYASESLGEKFYLKNNEVIHASVRVNNTSNKPFLQTTSYYCHRNINNAYAPPECAHEFTFDIKHDAMSQLIYDDFGCYHIDRDVTWTLAGSESFEREKLLFGAGYFASDDRVDIYTNKDKEKGFHLYGRSLFENGACDFTGTVSFSYNSEDGSENEIACKVKLKVFYVSD